jgi:type I restriction enzyme, S subunit
MTPGDGQGGTGKVFHYVNGKFEAHQRVYVFKDFVGILAWYFYYFLSTFLRPVALAGSNTVTMESLRRPLLADFKVGRAAVG